MLPDPAIVCLTNADPGKTRWYGTEMSPRNRNVAFAEPQQHVIDPTNPGGALDDGIENRLQSVGERLMIPSTSAVAVWCSKASRNSALRSWISLNNRTFSMAITACEAKVFSSATCLSVKGFTSVRRRPMEPIATPFLASREREGPSGSQTVVRTHCLPETRPFRSAGQPHG